MKIAAALMSFAAFFFAVHVDLNLSKYFTLIPAVKMGFDVDLPNIYPN